MAEKWAPRDGKGAAIAVVLSLLEKTSLFSHYGYAQINSPPMEKPQIATSFHPSECIRNRRSRAIDSTVILSALSWVEYVESPIPLHGRLFFGFAYSISGGAPTGDRRPKLMIYVRRVWLSKKI
jgi:hypothetical protein